MNEKIDWDQKVEFNGYSHWTGYEHLYIPTCLTYREVFVALGTLMLTDTDISLIHYEFNYTLYGNFPVFCVRNFDFNSILFTFATYGVIELKGTKKVMLTEKGKQFLSENETIGISFFEEKRQKTKSIIAASHSNHDE